MVCQRCCFLPHSTRSVCVEACELGTYCNGSIPHTVEVCPEVRIHPSALTVGPIAHVVLYRMAGTLGSATVAVLSITDILIWRNWT